MSGLFQHFLKSSSVWTKTTVSEARTFVVVETRMPSRTNATTREEQRNLLRCYVGSVRGMQRFRAFLKDKQGENLLVFWVEAEYWSRLQKDHTEGKDAAWPLQQTHSMHDILRRRLLQCNDLDSDTETSSQPTVILGEHLRTVQRNIMTQLHAYWVPQLLLHICSEMPKIPLQPRNPSEPLNPCIETASQFPYHGIKIQVGVHDIHCSCQKPGGLSPLDVSPVEDRQECSKPATERDLDHQSDTEMKKLIGHLDIGKRKKNVDSHGVSTNGAEEEETVVVKETLFPMIRLQSEITLSKSEAEIVFVMPTEVDMALVADSLAGSPFHCFLKNNGLDKQAANLDLWQECETFCRLATTSDQWGDAVMYRKHLASRIHMCLESPGLMEQPHCAGLKCHRARRATVPRMRATQHGISQALQAAYKMFLNEEKKKFLNTVVPVVNRRTIKWAHCSGTTALHQAKLALLLTELAAHPKEDHHRVGCEDLLLNAWEDLGNGGSIVYPQEPTIHFYDYEKMSLGDLVHCKPAMAVERLSKNFHQFCSNLPYIVPQKANVPLNSWKRFNLKVMTKNSIVIHRPSTCPRDLRRILKHPVHSAFFRYFLQIYDAEAPLKLWNALEKLRNAPKSRYCSDDIQSIVQTFFKKDTDIAGLLYCNSPLLKDVQETQSATYSQLMKIQTLIYKAMVDKWFLLYQETFDQAPSVQVIEKKVSRPKLVEVHEKERIWLNLKSFFISVFHFQRAISDRTSWKAFEKFLRPMIQSQEPGQQIGPEASSFHLHTMKSAMSIDNTSGKLLQRKLSSSKRQQSTLNLVINDLKFFREIEKFKMICEAVSDLEEAGLCIEGFRSLLWNKAYTINKLFLDSDILPRIRVNVPDYQARMVLEAVQHGAVTRSLFHNCTISIISILIPLWRKYTVFRAMETYKDKTTVQNTNAANYFKTRLNEPSDLCYASSTEDIKCQTLRFNLSNGIQLILPSSSDYSFPSFRTDSQLDNIQTNTFGKEGYDDFQH
uniref:regulator of G-protein signaling protein-like isoform X2 n=1 Tax=Myxine glutinosa TaxID=7769 RepID=UPI00358F2DD7